MKILRKRESARMLGMSGVTLWRRWKSDPTFPEAVDLGNSVGWVEDELIQWVESRRVTPQQVTAKYETERHRPRSPGRPKKIKPQEVATDGK